MEELKLFRLRADQAMLSLPFKYAEIIAWDDEIALLIDWTDSIDQQLSTLPALVAHVRDIVRSKRFECATSADQATIVLVWSGIEDKFGETEKAVAALKWGLAKLNDQPRNEATDKLAACMRGQLSRLQRKLEAKRGLQGSAEPEAARGSDVAADSQQAEHDLQLLTSGVEHRQTPSQEAAAAPAASVGTAEVPEPLISAPSPPSDELSRV